MRSFSDLFTGRDDVHGTYSVPAGTKRSEKGKLAGTASTKRGPVTPAMYEAHLKGKKRLGIVPIRLDNSTMWIAIDADVYKDPKLYPTLAGKINKLGLPLCMTLSKSGGAHLWCFFRDPVPAKRAREIAADYIKKLGLDAKTEIFPKQETILESDDGSWINLPYFGGTCVGLAADGSTQLDLEEFLTWADDRIVSKGDLKITAEKSAEQDDGDDDAPPCIDTMLEEGIEEGGRDNALLHIGVYLMRKYPDDWEDKLQETNDESVHPPVSMDDMARIVRSLNKKSYQYLCKQQPMCAACQKDVCLTRKYGVGSGASADAAVMFDALEKIDYDDPIYRVTMQGRTFEVGGEELMAYRLFRIAAMKKLNMILPGMKDTIWQEILNDQFQTMTISEPPSDTQLAARVVDQFKDWCSQSASKRADMVLQGQPYFDGKSVIFLGGSFMMICDKIFRTTRGNVWMYMRDFGCVEDTIELKGKTIKVWRLPVSDPWFDIDARGRE